MPSSTGGVLPFQLGELERDQTGGGILSPQQARAAPAPLRPWPAGRPRIRSTIAQTSWNSSIPSIGRAVGVRTSVGGIPPQKPAARWEPPGSQQR